MGNEENCFSSRTQFESCWWWWKLNIHCLINRAKKWVTKLSHSPTSSWTIIKIVPFSTRKKFSSKFERNCMWWTRCTKRTTIDANDISISIFLAFRVYKKFRNLSPDLVPLDMTSPESPKIRIPKERLIKLSEFQENP